MSPWTAAGRAALDQVIQTQASIISYIDDFKLMMILSLAAISSGAAAAPRGSTCRRRPRHGGGMSRLSP
jgi:hypothetical protein